MRSRELQRLLQRDREAEAVEEAEDERDNPSVLQTPALSVVEGALMPFSIAT